VIADTKAHPGRELKSVVTTSRSMAKELSYAKVQALSEEGKVLYVRPIERLFDSGVPLVCSAGNQTLGALDIDELPMVVKDKKHPVGRLTSETKEKLKTGYIQRLFMVVLVYLRMLRRCT
jgi:hypothetical protein